MRSILFLLFPLPLLAACELAGPSDTFSMTGRWTVQLVINGSGGDHDWWQGTDFDFSFQCTGPATLTLRDTGQGITGTNVGTLTCSYWSQNHGSESRWATPVSLNGDVVGDRSSAAVMLQVSCFTTSSTGLSLAGSMTADGAASGSISGQAADCGLYFLTTLSGRWSATRD